MEPLTEKYVSFIKTPFGCLKAEATSAGISGLSFTNKDSAARINKPAGNSYLDTLEKELKCYFSGTLREFNLPLVYKGTPFQESVWKELSSIPYGKTSCYAEIALLAGHPLAFRAVGSAIGSNPLAILIPCHRVINKSGKTGGFAGGPSKKAFLLEHENKAFLSHF